MVHQFHFFLWVWVEETGGVIGNNNSTRLCLQSGKNCTELRCWISVHVRTSGYCQYGNRSQRCQQVSLQTQSGVWPCIASERWAASLLIDGHSNCLMYIWFLLLTRVSSERLQYSLFIFYLFIFLYRKSGCTWLATLRWFNWVWTSVRLTSTVQTASAIRTATGVTGSVRVSAQSKHQHPY